MLNRTKYIPTKMCLSLFLNAITGVLVWEDWRVIYSWLGYICTFLLMLLGVYLMSTLEFFIVVKSEQKDAVVARTDSIISSMIRPETMATIEPTNLREMSTGPHATFSDPCVMSSEPHNLFQCLVGHLHAFDKPHGGQYRNALAAARVRLMTRILMNGFSRSRTICMECSRKAISIQTLNRQMIWSIKELDDEQDQCSC